MAAGLLGKAINHAEAKARALALRLRREERLEHTIDDGRIDTGPGVAHRDHDVLPRHRIGVALAVLAVERHVNRKSVVSGKSVSVRVDPGGGRKHKKKKI